MNVNVASWARPPIEAAGNKLTNSIIDMSDDQVRRLIKLSEEIRYSLDDWRNRSNRWCALLHSGVSGKRVLDYGCGWGIEALQLARNGALVILSDVIRDNIEAASRVLHVHGFSTYHIWQHIPDADWDMPPADIFFANGVLHHCPEPDRVLQMAANALPVGGEARIMVYNKTAWQQATGQSGLPPPRAIDDKDTYFKFLRTMDAVGVYADWYDADKMASIAAPNFKLDYWEDIADGRYSVAILKKI